MDVDECVLSAGRAVLDMVEQEWQPLSPGELEQRLDQAVEETLEAELVASLRAQPSPTLYVQLLQNQANVSPQVPPSTADEEAQEPADPQEPVGGAALQVPVRFSSAGNHFNTPITQYSIQRGKAISSRWDPVCLNGQCVALTLFIHLL